MVIRAIAAVGIAALIAVVIVALTAPALPVQFTVVHECIPTQSSGFTIWR